MKVEWITDVSFRWRRDDFPGVRTEDKGVLMGPFTDRRVKVNVGRTVKVGEGCRVQGVNSSLYTSVCRRTLDVSDRN